MFERFTDRARRAVVLAREEAASRGHLEVTTGHLLLGLLREEEADGTGRDGIAAQALRVLGVTFADTSEAMDGYWGRNAPTTGHLPYTAEMKAVLTAALREAVDLAHPYLGTEHLLLGLCRLDMDDAERAWRLLAGHGLNPKKVRRQVMVTLGTLKVPPQPEIDRLLDIADSQTAGLLITLAAIRAEVAKLKPEGS